MELKTPTAKWFCPKRIARMEEPVLCQSTIMRHERSLHVSQTRGSTGRDGGFWTWGRGGGGGGGGARAQMIQKSNDKGIENMMAKEGEEGG